MKSETSPSDFATYTASDVLSRPPHLRLDPETAVLELAIPALAEGVSFDRPRWQVTTAYSERPTSLREFAAHAYGEPPLAVALPAPFSRLTVTLVEGAAAPGTAAEPAALYGPLTLPGVSPARPFLVLDGADRLVEELAAGIYKLIAPQGTVAEGAVGSPAAHGQWPGWQVQELDLRRGGSLSITAPLAEPAQLAVGPRPDAEWDTAVKTLPNARDGEGEPIYTQSPRLSLRGEGEWLLEVTYAPLGGEEEAVSESALDAGGTFEILPSDLYEDPWVGRYRFRLYRDGEAVEERFFSVAEGLHMRFKNEGPRGTDFRFIDALGKHSPFSYALASDPAKPIAVDKGQRVLGDTEPTRVEKVSSEAGYELAFEVVPQSLRTRIKRIGLEPTEHLDKPVVLAGQLDQDGAFTVHSPRPLPLAKFVTIDNRQKIKELARTRGSTQATTSLALPNATLVNAVRKQPDAELFLMWSTQTYEDYLAGLPESERAAHLTRPHDRRVIEYEASAAGSLVYAALATVRSVPLASRGLFGERGLEVEGNLPPQCDLLGWAWPLADPAGAPVPLHSRGDHFDAPEQLREAGTLLVDVRELEPGSNLAAPARPASSSLVVSFPESIGQSVSADENWSAPQLWQAFHALHALSMRSPNAKLQAMFDSVIEQLRRGPYEAVAALGGSGINAAQQARALVRSRLFHAPLTPPGAAGPQEAAPANYPGLLTAIQFGVGLEEAGSAELARARATGVDSVTRPLLLAAAAAATAAPTVDGLATESARIAALRECFAANAAFHELGTVDKLRKDATVLSRKVQEAGVDMSVSHTLIALGAFASGTTAGELAAAAWMPYVSYAFALAARGVAAGALSELSLLKDDMPKLADAMSLAPHLFFFDLLTAEALFQAKR